MNKQLKRQWLMGLAGTAFLAASFMLNSFEQKIASDSSTQTVTLTSATTDTGLKYLQDCATCQACLIAQQVRQIKTAPEVVTTPAGNIPEV
jgi:hypothetical protein